MVLTGSDGLAAGLEQNLWIKLLPTYNDKFPGLEANYEPAALNLHKAQGQGFGVVINYYPSGPLIEYAPERVKDVPEHGRGIARLGEGASEALHVCAARQFRPGRTFMMGLPYILGDKDPADPVKGWDKTWEYLRETQSLHRILSRRHRRDHEGIRRGIARHHHLDHRLGHQSACPRHRARQAPRSARSKASTGSPTRSS